MAFTATITDIKQENSLIEVFVRYNDSVTSFTTDQIFRYSDDGTLTQSQALSDIQTVGKQLKSNLSQNNTLRSKIGTVITIN